MPSVNTQDYFTKLYDLYRSGAATYPAKDWYNTLGVSGAWSQNQITPQNQIQGGVNLYKMLQDQGRVDPRLLASAQAQNAMSTQQQQTSARGNAVRSGFGNSGLAAALQAAIGSAGANRAAGLNYKDIADSYQRNQQNLDILNQNVINPAIQYAGIGQGLSMQQSAQRNQNQQNQQSAYLQAMGTGLGLAFCKAAKELYGEESDDFHNARAYVLAKVPAETSIKYAIYGDEMAQAAKNNPKVRERLRPVFDEFARRGAKMREEPNA